MPVATSASLLLILFFFPFLVRNKLGPLWPKMPVAVRSLPEGPQKAKMHRILREANVFF